MIVRASRRVPDSVVIATRESALALWQAQHVQAALRQLYPAMAVSILGMTTEGDRNLGSSLAKIGGKGLFVKELEDALADGRADIAVHSMKDVPMHLPEGYVLAAVLERADPRDAFVSTQGPGPAALPAGARVGTSSLRRECQLRANFPHLLIEPLRGNVQTRLRKLDEGQYGAIILAAAGLKRLGLADRITALLTPEQSLPAVGQGALGIECRGDRADLLDLLAPLAHLPTQQCVTAERAFSRALAGSCNVPLAGFAERSGDELRLRGLVGSPDGRQVVRGEVAGAAADADALGLALAADLRNRGAAEILAALAHSP
ncbi:MAG: hydroxymethylbilane synthase [Betaproteobacteria bacterium]|jgi:hydroxymethylbilane synthase|nr:hydroxymethylbilane synthase [Betaproteobacteria bacterium]MDH4292453.1 hydroxymethylbilane synthase [Betaproteobacteria bacterium]MDH5341438.1 hydroxymethylbilane synthase [Betaproteobacteria bacterium]